ncbi:membrane magnesium transporter-domain-containing protein [Zychaea mexicana]|uniref:membrane magnesium transporter-domain-containing protein n=1 Tax=Zychaea mexicana TaxID=64656 RepID=UPI0022FE30A1|nr:membrane magnesium transporter-domain-containing protein [Zychaea mexicana]KAI9495732.1 membrane magnesium transporter-domain-containing protein [Zychaea mexicana]
MSQSAGKVIALISTLFLAHSAFSTYEHLSYLKAVEQAESVLPIEIVVECLLSALATLFGVIISAAPFKNIALESQMSTMTIDKFDTRPSFVGFNHRKIVSTQGQLERRLR